MNKPQSDLIRSILRSYQEGQRIESVLDYLTDAELIRVVKRMVKLGKLSHLINWASHYDLANTLKTLIEEKTI